MLNLPEQAARVVSWSDKRLAVDTTSRSGTWSRGLSPFFLGPCPLYGQHVAQNVENGWQYAKVYEEFTLNGEPTDRYLEWATAGWAEPKANRYPVGKGRKPLYSLWDGRKLTYLEARKQIYIPLYCQAVVKTEAFRLLREQYEEYGSICLRDFDGYDRRDASLTDVLNNPDRKMGHAFVLAMLLTRHPITIPYLDA